MSRPSLFALLGTLVLFGKPTLSFAQSGGNESQDIRELRAKAESGDAFSQYQLGLRYDFGINVTENDAEAVKWYRRAADQGDASAQLVLGAMYGNGEGAPKNDAEAYFWFNLAAAQGNKDAKNNRAILETIMTREQIAEAQRRSAAWKPRKE